MTSDGVMDVMQRMLLVAFQLAGPVLLASIAVGLVIAIFQAATQIHEQTLTFVPKLLAIALILLILGGWMYSAMSEFAYYIFDLMAEV